MSREKVKNLAITYWPPAAAVVTLGMFGWFLALYLPMLASATAEDVARAGIGVVALGGYFAITVFYPLWEWYAERRSRG